MAENQTDAPSADDIRAARTTAALTQAEAASLVHATDRAWRYWEAGVNAMPVSLWELFQLKVAQRQAVSE